MQRIHPRPEGGQGVRWTCFLLALVLGFLGARTSRAQEELSCLGTTTGGANYACTAAAGRLYAGAGSTLRIFDTSPIHTGAAAAPEFLGEFHCGSLITDILVSDDLVFVAANYDGVYLFNVTDPPQGIPVLAHVRLEEAGAGAQDLTLTGDLLLVANITEMTVYRWDGSDLLYERSFAEATGDLLVTGAEARGDLIAVSVQDRSGDSNGIHFYRADDYEEEPDRFWRQPRGYPEDVSFSDEHDDVLYVAGGTVGLFGHGYFHVIRTAPGGTTAAYSDSVPGSVVALGPGYVLNAESRNDTVYVATLVGDCLLGGACEGDPDTQSKVRVYDCSEPDSVALIGRLPAGLYHFDLALDEELVHIASEWCGIKTLRVRDLGAPEELCLTPTGGAMNSVDVHGDRIAVGRDGYGFDVLRMVEPIPRFELLGHARPGAFSNTVRFSDDGTTLFVGSSTIGFWWFDLSPLDAGESEPALIDSVQIDLFGFEEIAVSGDWVYATHQQEVFRFDTSNGESLVEAGSWRHDQTNWYPRDLEARGDTVLAAQRRPFFGGALRVLVFDATGNAQLIGEISRAVQACTAVAWDGDEVFAAWDGIGIEKYRLYRNGSTVELEGPLATYPWEVSPKKVRIDCDSNLVYVAAGPTGLLALDRATLELVGIYPASGGTRNLWDRMQGCMDVHAGGDWIYLADYHSQMNLILNPYATSAPDGDPPPVLLPEMRVLPNPCRREATLYLRIPDAGRTEAGVYDLQGRMVRTLLDDFLPAGEHAAVWDGRVENGAKAPAGIYFLTVRTDRQTARTIKTVLVR